MLKSAQTFAGFNIYDIMDACTEQNQQTAAAFCSQVCLSGGSVNQASSTCEHTVGKHEACCWYLNAIINHVS